MRYSKSALLSLQVKIKKPSLIRNITKHGRCREFQKQVDDLTLLRDSVLKKTPSLDAKTFSMH